MITDLVTKANNGVLALAATLATNKGTGVTTADLNASTGWPQDASDGPVHFAIFKVDAGTDQLVPGTLTFWKATLSGNTLSNMQLTGGLNQNYVIGDSALITSTPGFINDLVTAYLTEHNRTGGHKDITATSITTTGNATIGGAASITGNMTINGTLTVAGSSSAGGWTPISGTISAATYNGNRSYTLTPTADNTASISPGMRLRTTRTVAAPTQCTSLNGTSQYYNKSSPAGMTSTDDITVGAWVKMTSYSSTLTQVIASRFNGTSGWRFGIMTGGQVQLIGFNAGGGNYSYVYSQQAIPLNKWVYVTAQLDMSAFTATSTTSYVMIDGVDVPAAVARAGTNPIAFVQAGNLEIGSANATDFFPGKIAQVAIFSAKVAQATMRSYISQGISGAEASLVSAYSFNNSVNDLNTTNANNLTAQGSAVATNADSPFGNTAASSTLDYAIVQTVSAGTLVVQVAEGCTIPTTGGVAAASYSSLRVPYGFPGTDDKWTIGYLGRVNAQQSSPVALTWYNQFSAQLNVPVGYWSFQWSAATYAGRAGASACSVATTLSTSASADTENDLTTLVYSSSVTEIEATVGRSKTLAVSTATPYYLIMRTLNASMSTISFQSQDAPTIITAKNAYL